MRRPSIIFQVRVFPEHSNDAGAPPNALEKKTFADVGGGEYGMERKRFGNSFVGCTRLTNVDCIFDNIVGVPSKLQQTNQCRLYIVEYWQRATKPEPGLVA